MLMSKHRRLEWNNEWIKCQYLPEATSNKGMLLGVSFHSRLFFVVIIDFCGKLVQHARAISITQTMMTERSMKIIIHARTNASPNTPTELFNSK